MPDSQHPASSPQRRKPTLTPPDAGDVRKKGNPLTVLLLLVGLFVLLGVAAVVVWLLPHAADPKSSSTGHQASQMQVLPPEDPPAKQPDLARAEIEEYLGEWLKLQARAEADNVSVWGADAYPAILTEIAKADQLFQEIQFTDALASYKKAIASLQDLLNSKEERLAAALTKGALALDNHDSHKAAKAFELALTLEPNNEPAIQGAGRARNLDQVLKLYNMGLDYERQNDLAAARKTLQQAINLDKEFSPAGDVLKRVETRQQSIAFQEAMSSTLKALAQNNAAAARRSLAEAARLRPADISVMDTGRRLAALEKTQKLSLLQTKAEKMAAEERWQDALNIFDEALAIDPHFGFAETGRDQAWQRLELDKNIRQILAHPARLQEKGPLEGAEQMLTSAKSIENPGPKLYKQIIELEELVRKASIPVTITLRSDNKTNVVIYRIGRLGNFLEKRLDLLPGSYTVVGSRTGFRDVRLPLQVKAGDDSPVIFEIRCKEPI